MEEKKRNEQRETVNHMQSLVGALCEVMTVENHLVCIGRLSHADNRELTLVPATARELPPVIYNTRFKLRIYRLADAPLEMEGSICANGPTKWQFDRLVDLNLMEKRRTFRQRTRAAAYVLPYRPEEEEQGEQAPLPESQVGVVLDISVGGLQLRCRTPFQQGDRISVQQVRLEPEGEAFDFLCEVRWARYRPERDDWFYGCLFAPPLNRQQEDRLCSAIFSLQRHELHRHRNS